MHPPFRLKSEKPYSIGAFPLINSMILANSLIDLCHPPTPSRVGVAMRTHLAQRNSEGSVVRMDTWGYKHPEFPLEANARSPNTSSDLGRIRMQRGACIPRISHGRKQNRKVFERVKNRQKVVFWPVLFWTLSPDSIEHLHPRLSPSLEIKVRTSLELRSGCDAPPGSCCNAPWVLAGWGACRGRCWHQEAFLHCTWSLCGLWFLGTTSCLVSGQQFALINKGRGERKVVKNRQGIRSS